MHNNQPQQRNQPQLFEGLEYGDLERLVHPKVHVDEFKSKMGDDADIVVLSFKVGGKEPAMDLMNFIERGYDWVLDADVSAGELEDGEYLVFVEFERSPEAAIYIVKLVEDIINLTKQGIDEWQFQYRKNGKKFDLTVDNLKQQVPTTPEGYIARFGAEEAAEDELEELEGKDELAAMQEAAGVPMRITAPKNEYTERLRAAAGLR